MQQVVFDKPYEFIPPSRSWFWPMVVKLYLRRYLKKAYAVHSIEYRDIDKLKTSVDAGHGILLAPNHCRMCDPLILGMVSKKLKINYHAMVSWHAFQADRFTARMIRRLGGFSVYREGTDRKALNMAIDILAEADRPLIVFPEGALSRHNDQLMALMDGISMMVRSAAKRRAKLDPPGQVVVHPAAIRYYFHGNLEETLTPVLEEIESHFAWHPSKEKPLLDRIRKIGEAFLALKEVEYFGNARVGDVYERVESLIDHVLAPIEKEWNISKADGTVVRVKNIRQALLPELIEDNISEEEREKRWRQLAACFYAQQMSHYPKDYIGNGSNVTEHILETVERFEEDLTDETRIHGPLHATVQIGEAIPVTGKRDRNAEVDPIMEGIESQLTTMLAGLAAEAVPLS